MTAAAALLLVALFFLPLWSIRLTAPQYPEGIGMYIAIDTIVGATEFDLGKINKLNAYIGMRPIAADAIPELRFMPWFLAALIGGGLAAAAIGRTKAVYAWLAGFALFAVAGLADFYRWSYDYGHNLDVETAVIQVPGMTYQPPLIGSKQLLNFRATSWPASGGWLAGVSFALAMTAAVGASRCARRTATIATAVAIAACGSSTAGAQASAGRAVVIVSPAGPVRTLSEAIRTAPPGARIVVRAGTYREPTIVVDKPLEITGEGWPVLDGEGARQIMTVGADDVAIRGLVFRDVGASFVDDRAAIRVSGASRCSIEDNRIENAFFGIYLAGVTGCRITRNVIRGVPATEAASGNGIHLWSSSDITVDDNRVGGHRDGIYLEFVRNTAVERNVSEGNGRYGLHFMYSDDCRYVGNTFRRNLAGVAVMYTKRVAMIDNRFEDNWGSASYGLLLKEISDPRIEGNRFHRNTVGLVADGAMRIVATDNEFSGNGWAVKLMASTDEGRFERNDFVGNTFDVATNSRETANRFAENYFDSYRGYDLDRDGFGDVSHRPVRLFSMIIERNPPAVILLRSFLVGVLDVAERMLPSLTPADLADERPAMRSRR